MVQVAGQVVSQVRLTRKKAQVESWVFAFGQKKKDRIRFFQVELGQIRKF